MNKIIGLIISLLIASNVYGYDQFCYRYRSYAEQQECERRNRSEEMQKEQEQMQRKQLELQQQQLELQRQEASRRQSEQSSISASPTFTALSKKDQTLVLAIKEGVQELSGRKLEGLSCKEIRSTIDKIGLSDLMGIRRCDWGSSGGIPKYCAWSWRTPEGRGTKEAHKFVSST